MPRSSIDIFPTLLQMAVGYQFAISRNDNEIISAGVGDAIQNQKATKLLIICTVTLAATRTVDAGTILIDFGTSDAVPTLGGTWNAISFAASGSTSLVDTNSTVASGVTLNWSGFGGPADNASPQTRWGADKLWVDARATGDLFQTASDDSTAVITIAGLDAVATYDFDFVASRAKLSAGPADYLLNGSFADSTLNGDDFSAYDDGFLSESILTWNSQSLDGNGDLVLTFVNPDNFGYATALRIQKSAQVPEPCSLAIFDIGALGLVAGGLRRGKKRTA